MKLSLLFLTTLAGATSPPQLGQKPQMGWNSWNTFKLNISAELVKSTTNALIDTGLADLGYKYVVLDDGWQAKERDSNGLLAANSTKFPNGLSEVVDYVHQRGLKVGIYSDAGIYTCGFFPGSYGYEELDAQTFAEWGFDYLKYDNCGGFQSNTLSVQERFLRMSQALALSGRQIFYALCQWGNQFPWLWADQMAESYRMSGDIHKSFAKDAARMCTTAYCLNQGYAGVSVLTMIRKMREIAPFSKPGSWADMDMLEVGTWSMTELEEQTHFAFWAALKSPLIIGANLNNISDTSLAIYKNKEIINLNQDDAGAPATFLPELSVENRYQVWAGPLTSGRRRHVILALNYGNQDEDIEIPITKVPGLLETSQAYRLKVRDVWARKDMGLLGDKITLKGVKPSQTKVLILTF